MFLLLLSIVPTTTSFVHTPCNNIRQCHLTVHHSWKSCPQPRFDEFTSCTVGPWVASATEDDTDQPSTQEEVEEVMRSCGGAIQGIRELPLSLIISKVDYEARTYHNRADSGFVYADDGTYTSGKEKWNWDCVSSDDESLMMASLSFPDRRRMWLTIEVSDALEMAVKCIEKGGNNNIMLNFKALELSRPVSSSSVENIENRTEDDTIELSSSYPPDIDWNVIQRVRMPNSNQSWSLPRAKWEKMEVETDQKVLPVSKLMGWTFMESISLDQANPLFGDATNTDTLNIHMLAVCPTSKIARSVVRCYDDSGYLKSVAFLYGRLPQNTKN